MTRRGVVALLTSVGKNAVPATGFFILDWSALTPMLLYLIENVSTILFAALAVSMLAPQREEIDGEMKARRDSLNTFLLVGGGFSFVAACITTLVFLSSGQSFPDDFLLSIGSMIAFQVMAFGNDLTAMRGVTLKKSEEMLTGVLGRIFLLAFAVWAGIFAGLLFTPRAFVIPFIVLKTLADLWRIRPEALERRLLTI